MNISFFLLVALFKQIMFNFFKNLTLNQIVRYFDYVLLLYIIISTIIAIVGLCASLVECLSILPSGFENSVLQMNRGTPDNYGFINPGSNNPGGPGTPDGFPPGVPGSHHTNVHIIHDDGNWSNGIRNLFIYGSGSARMIMSLRRNGGPTQQLFILGITLVAETTTRVVLNAINDPNYIRAHIWNLRTIIHGSDSASVYMDARAEQAAIATNSNTSPSATNGPVSSTTLGSGDSSANVSSGTDDIAKSVIGIDIDLAKIWDSVLSKIVNYLNYLFEPVQHSFTIDVMSSHVQNLSVLLFILAALILFFFLSFLFNITLFIFSSKLLNYFSNKYILWYLNFNKKVIGLEILILSGWIGYLLYVLLTGLHYLSTHPVIYSSIGS